ncbi:replication protein P [Idiomarina xiamenensis]|uniref:replication protein P n=1 Tax=Idiomarina xiamenensis TaxID=1207041 RepID=UPI0012EA8019|nr:replication protein P [Idiomarina xiamenensis]
MTILNARLKPVFGLYCVDFASRFGEHADAVMREYARQLIKHRVGHQGLSRGIERVKERAAKDRFTPNPTEFVYLCKPSADELGIPDLNIAVHEVRQARTTWRHSKTPYPYSHDICRHMNDRIGYEIYQLSERLWRQNCEREYQRLLELAINGELPSHKPSIEAARTDDRPMYEQLGYQTLSPEEAKRVLAATRGKRLTNVRGRVDTSRLGPGIAGSSDTSNVIDGGTNDRDAS